MAQTPDEIKQHIEFRRGQLAQDLNELEHRVRSTIDWRLQFEEHAAMALGLAFGGGLLAGLMTGGRGRAARRT